MKRMTYIWSIVAGLFLMTACADEDIVKKQNEIQLLIPTLRIDALPSGAEGRAEGGYVEWSTIESAILYLDLLDADGNVERSTTFNYANGTWETADPITVSGGAGTYSARMAIDVTSTSDTKFYASYKGDIDVNVDGSFSAILHIYTSRITVNLMDENADIIKDDDYSVEYSGIATTGINVAEDVVVWSGDKPTFKNEVVISGKSGVAIDNFVPGEVPDSWNKDGDGYVSNGNWGNSSVLFTIKYQDEEIAVVKYQNEDGKTNIVLEPGKYYVFDICLDGTKEITVANITKKPWEENGMPIDIKTKGLTQLAYDANTDTYSVSGPYGLMYLQQWMNSGSEEKPLTNKTGVEISERMAVNITLTKEIDMSVLPNQDDVDINQDKVTYSALAWKSIGDENNPYTGTFNGDGYKVKGLSLENGYEGLVGVLGAQGVVAGVILDASGNKASTLVVENNGIVLACANWEASTNLVMTNNKEIISCYTNLDQLSAGGTGGIQKYSYHSATSGNAKDSNGNTVLWTVDGTFPITIDMNRGIAEYNNYEIVQSQATFGNEWLEDAKPLQQDGAAKWYMENNKEHYKRGGFEGADGNFKVYDEINDFHSGYEAWNETGLNLWATDITDDKQFYYDLYVADDITLQNKWTHVIGDFSGLSTNDGKSYVGTIYGQGHAIDGMTIDRSSSSAVGFISCMGAGGLVQDLNFTNVDVKGAGQTGAIVGLCEEGGEVINCKVESGVVQGTEYVGGIVGWLSGKTTYHGDGPYKDYGIVDETCGLVEGCENTGLTVKGIFRVGGIVGECIGNSVIENCHNSATVEGIDGTAASKGHIGGIVGTAHGMVFGCYNEGDITSQFGTVGGIAGSQGTRFDNSFCSIAGCYNTGNIIGKERVGGIVGANHDVTLGTVDADSSDDLKTGYIIGCYSTGTVGYGSYNTGAKAHGKIVGFLKSEDYDIWQDGGQKACISKCYATPEEGNGYGIVGQASTQPLSIAVDGNGVVGITQTEIDLMNGAIAGYNGLTIPNYANLGDSYKCNYYFDSGGKIQRRTE